MFELTYPSKHHALVSASKGSCEQTETDNQGSDFESWIGDHEEELMRFAFQRVGDRQLAEDLVQDTLLAGWRSQQRFGGRSKLSTWLFSILRNKITDHFRRTRTVKLQSELGAEEMDAASRQYQSGPSFGTPVEREEFWLELQHCLEQLPTKLATAFRMREIEGESTAATCGRLRISPTNLSMRLHRARAALQKRLSPEWSPYAR